MKLDKRSLIKLLVTLAIAAVCLYLAFRGADWRQMLAVLGRMRPHQFLACFAIMSFSVLLRSLRWRVLVSARKRLPAGLLFWTTAIGYFGNNFLPARAGELIRAATLGWAGGLSKSFVLATALTERVMDALVLLLVAAIGLASLPQLPAWLAQASRGMALACLVAVAFFLLLPRVQGLVVRLLRRLPIPPRFEHALEGMVASFSSGLTALVHPGRAARFFLLTAVIWSADTAGAVLLANFLSLPVGPVTAILLLAALGLSSAVPSTPGYVGVYQFVAVTVLAPFRIARDEALAYVVLFQAVIYTVVCLWGGLGFWRLRR